MGEKSKWPILDFSPFQESPGFYWTFLQCVVNGVEAQYPVPNSMCCGDHPAVIIVSSHGCSSLCQRCHPRQSFIPWPLVLYISTFLPSTRQFRYGFFWCVCGGAPGLHCSRLSVFCWFGVAYVVVFFLAVSALQVGAGMWSAVTLRVPVLILY